MKLSGGADSGGEYARLQTHIAALFDELEQRLRYERAVILEGLTTRVSSGIGAKGGKTGARSRQHDLQEALREAVAVLEETKRSFKSKRLAELRVKLERVLANHR